MDTFLEDCRDNLPTDVLQKILYFQAIAHGRSKCLCPEATVVEWKPFRQMYDSFFQPEFQFEQMMVSISYSKDEVYMSMYPNDSRYTRFGGESFMDFYGSLENPETLKIVVKNVILHIDFYMAGGLIFLRRIGWKGHGGTILNIWLIYKDYTSIVSLEKLEPITVRDKFYTIKE